MPRDEHFAVVISFASGGMMSEVGLLRYVQ